MGRGGCQTRVKAISLGRWEAEADPHLSVYRTTALAALQRERAQGWTEAPTLLGAVFSTDLRAQILPHTLLDGWEEMGLRHQEIGCIRQQGPQVHLARVNKSAYGAKPRGGKGWQAPRGQISKIPARKGPRRTLLPGS